MSRDLDQRRLSQVKPRELTGEDYSDGSFKQRGQHSRLVEMVGEEEAKVFERRLYEWRKAWDQKPVVTTPW